MTVAGRHPWVGNSAAEPQPLHRPLGAMSRLLMVQGSVFKDDVVVLSGPPTLFTAGSRIKRRACTRASRWSSAAVSAARAAAAAASASPVDRLATTSRSCSLALHRQRSSIE